MKPYTDMMMDLETLSTNTNAVILQVGWVFFDRNSPGRKMFSRGWYPDIEEQQAMGFQIDISTLEWWMQEHAEEYRVQQHANRLPADQIAYEMRSIWESAGNDGTQVWAKGTHFDFPIYRKLFPELWHFRFIHDLRTLKLAGEMRRIDVETHNHRPHDAVADAETQAKEVQALCSTISLDV